MNEKLKAVPLDLPEGAQTTFFRGRLIVAHPDAHPYFLDVDWDAPGGPIVAKTPIIPVEPDQGAA